MKLSGKALMKRKDGYIKEVTTITLFSKMVAMILVVVLPFIGFYFGIKSASYYLRQKVWSRQNN